MLVPAKQNCHKRKAPGGDGVCRAWHSVTQNKRGYAHLTERGAEIPGTAKSDSEAVKLAQEGKLKRWFVKTAKGQ